MATPTTHADSPVPTQVRNYHTVGDTILLQVQKVISGAVSGTTAEAAITAAIATIQTGGSPAPTKWAAFTQAAAATIDCCELAANNIQERRSKLWQAAQPYLETLLGQVKKEEQAFQNNRGYFIVQARVTDLNYLAGVFGDCLATGRTLTVEAS
jgi:hypothetical protein